MKILVLKGPRGKALYYGEPDRVPEGTRREAEGAGLLSWAESQYSKFENAVHRSESGIGRGIKKVWKYLERFVGADESFLRGLRNQPSFELIHSTHEDPAAVEAAWTDYLGANRRKHTVWLLVDMVISPLTLLLAPIPGPNLVGYWFTYRAFCHLLAVLGIRQFSDHAGVVAFQADPLLDREFSDWTESHVSQVADGYEMKSLSEFARRQIRTKAEPAAVSTAESP